MERLILFTKRPRVGRVKTRLAPPLSPDQALALYEAFLEDQVRFVRGLASDRIRVEIASDEPFPLANTLQGEGDLGERMLAAFRRSHRDGAAATVIVGVDCPTLPAGHVREAFERLRSGADAVVSPAEDGGYVLIGMGVPRPELFEEVPWGGPRVLEITRRRARATRIRLAEIAPWYDVDDAAGLSRLRDDLLRDTTRAPRTARALVRIDAGGSRVV